MAGTDYFDPNQYPDCVVILTPLNGTFQTKRIAVPDGHFVEIGRLQDTHADSPYVPRFNSKVVSRKHCVIYNNRGKFQIKDTGSAAGTFLTCAKYNDQVTRLSDQQKESTLFDLQDGDIVQLGDDYENQGVLHKCIKFRVSIPKLADTASSFGSTQTADTYRDDFVDLTLDPNVKREVQDEFDSVWSSVSSSLDITSKLARKSSYVVGMPIPGIPPQQPVSTPSPVSPPTVPQAEGASDCVNLINSINWDNPNVKAKALALANQGDPQILGYHRSMKQFPLAFKDVVTKYVNKP